MAVDKTGVSIWDNREGVCSTLPETLTPFQIKSCDFPYPIYDLITKLSNLIGYQLP